MNIECKKCGRTEPTNLGLFVKIIGGAAPVGGFWAWVTYLFAGTGFAMPIVIAIITGGVGLLIFKEQIVEWISNKGFKCPACSASDWKSVGEKLASKPESESNDAALDDTNLDDAQVYVSPDSKIMRVVWCAWCNQKTRISSGRKLDIKCPSCKRTYRVTS